MKRLGEGRRTRFWTGVGLVCVSAPLLTACPNPQTYGTPRTTPPGKLTHTIAAETMTVSGNVKTSVVDPETGEVVDEDESVNATFPLPPTYQLRIGVAEKVDLGIKVANMSSLGVDAKFNPVRGSFDFAVDPGFQWFRLSSGNESFGVAYFHLPLMLGLNLSRDVSFVLTPGLLYAMAHSSIAGDADEGAIFQSSGLAGRFGVGFEYRVSPKFALHPELTAIRGLTDDYGDNAGTIVLFGFGFNIANIPDYSDVDG